VLALGGLFWGRKVVEAKNAQIAAKDELITLAKQFSAEHVLPQFESMRLLHKRSLEILREQLVEVDESQRPANEKEALLLRLSAQIEALPDQIQALTMAAATWVESRDRIMARDLPGIDRTALELVGIPESERERLALEEIERDRLALEGSDRDPLALQGTDRGPLALEGSDRRRIALGGDVQEPGHPGSESES
jgi:hypothetical protein